jgi:cellulose 1,4-beta-cellobiosidase
MAGVWRGSQVTEIKRKDVQGGKVIESSFTKLDRPAKQYNSVFDKFFVVRKKAFGENDRFTKRSSSRQLGATLSKGRALVLSFWDDHNVNML